MWNEKLYTICNNLQGWRQLVIAILLGAIAALALPPFHLTPVVFVSFTGLLLLLSSSKQSSLWHSFKLGWCFGFGFFLAGLYWVVNALGVNLAKFFWWIPFAVLALPEVIAIYPAFAVSLTHLTKSKGLARCFWFAVFWVAGEWIRGHIFLAFPWNLVGYVWMSNLGILQTTAVTGIYGLSLITIFIATLPYLWFERKANQTARKASVVFAIIFCAIWGAGTLRIPENQATGPMMRLIQPNIAQIDKWLPQLTRNNFFHLLTLTARPAEQPIEYVVWPESAVTFFMDESPDALQLIARHLPQGSTLFTGSLRRTQSQVRNSLFAINDQAQVIGVYDKFHLLPFGEYMPMRWLLPSWIDKITPGDFDYSPSQGPLTLVSEKTIAISPLICFEGIFPGDVVSKDQQRPDCLINITNDAWFGYSSGPFQHFDIVRVRAIEEGIPLVRVANTGISGVIDSYGRVTAKLDLNQTGVLDAQLPSALAEPTIYGRYGDLILLILMVIFSSAGIICSRLRW